VLFGLVTAACGGTQPEPSYPLCDSRGAPACGNIGQVGRATDARVAHTATPSSANAARTGAIRRVPVVNVTLGASHEQPRTQAPDRNRLILSARASDNLAIQSGARPLANHREEIVCGNVMGKGSSRRVCRDRNGVVVSNTSTVEADRTDDQDAR
jgi:hypothetical protein